MIIYGPVINPQVTIGTNTYLVNIVLEEGEYLQINSRDRTIVKVLRNGEPLPAEGKRILSKDPTGTADDPVDGKIQFRLDCL